MPRSGFSAALCAGSMGRFSICRRNYDSTLVSLEGHSDTHRAVVATRRRKRGTRVFLGHVPSSVYTPGHLSVLRSNTRVLLCSWTIDRKRWASCPSLGVYTYICKYIVGLYIYTVQYIFIYILKYEYSFSNRVSFLYCMHSSVPLTFACCTLLPA